MRAMLSVSVVQAGLLWSFDGSEQLYCSDCKFTGQLSGAAPGIHKVVQLINTTITCKRLIGWAGYTAFLKNTAEVSQWSPSPEVK